MRKWLVVPVLGVALVAAGCQQTRQERVLTGAGIGAVAGGLIGYGLGGRAGGAVAGAVIGGVAGAIIADATRPGYCGYYYDKRGRKRWTRNC